MAASASLASAGGSPAAAGAVIGGSVATGDGTVAGDGAPAAAGSVGDGTTSAAGGAGLGGGVTTAGFSFDMSKGLVWAMAAEVASRTSATEPSRIFIDVSRQVWR